MYLNPFTRGLFLEQIRTNTFDFDPKYMMRFCLTCEMTDRIDWKFNVNQFICVSIYLIWFIKIDLIWNYPQNKNWTRHSCLSVSFTLVFYVDFLNIDFLPSLIRSNKRHICLLQCALCCTCVCDEYLFLSQKMFDSSAPAPNILYVIRRLKTQNKYTVHFNIGT